MDPALLISSAFILFFFGFNADPFLGAEESDITVHTLIDRVAKSFCGSVMLFGINHFTSIIWDQYENETLGLAGGNHPPLLSPSPSPSPSPHMATITAAADGVEQGDGDDHASHAGRPANNTDKQWDGLHDEQQQQQQQNLPEHPTASNLFEGPDPDPQPSSTPTSLRGRDSLSAYLNNTPRHRHPALGMQAAHSLDYHGNLNPNAYLTKHDFGIFVFCIVLPSIFLWWSTSRAKNRIRTVIDRESKKAAAASPPSCSCAVGDHCLAQNVVAPDPASYRYPTVPEQRNQDPLITAKLDEILTFARASSLPQQPEGVVSLAELESLINALDTAVSTNAALAQDLELLKRGQERFDRQIADLRAFEERANKRLDESMPISRKQDVVNVHTEDLRKRIEAVEQIIEDHVGLVETIEENQVPPGKLNRMFGSLKDGLLNEIKAAKTVVDAKLKQHDESIDALDERVQKSNQGIDTRLKKVEQKQNQSELENKFRELDRQVHRRITVSSEFSAKLKDLAMQFENLKQQTDVSTNFENKLYELDGRLKQNSNLMTGTFQKTQDKHEDAIHSLKGRIGKVENDQQDVSALQQALNTHNEEIGALKGKMGEIESGQQNIGALQETVNTLRENIGTLRGKVGKVKSNQQKIDAIQQTLNTQDKDIGALKEKIDKIESDQRDIDSLQQKLDIHVDDIEALKEHVEKLESGQQSISNEIEGIIDQNSTTTIDGKLDNLETSVNNRIIKKAKELQAQFEKGIEDLDIEKLRARLDSVESSLEEYKRKFGDIDSQLTTEEKQQVSTQVQDLTAKLAEVRETVESLQKTHEQENKTLSSTLSQKIEEFEANFRDIRGIANDLQAKVTWEVHDQELHAMDSELASSISIVSRVKLLEQQLGAFLAEWQSLFPTTEQQAGGPDVLMFDGQPPAQIQQSDPPNNSTEHPPVTGPDTAGPEVPMLEEQPPTQVQTADIPVTGTEQPSVSSQTNDSSDLQADFITPALTENFTALNLGEGPDIDEIINAAQRDIAMAEQEAHLYSDQPQIMLVDGTAQTRNIFDDMFEEYEAESSQENTTNPTEPPESHPQPEQQEMLDAIEESHFRMQETSQGEIQLAEPDQPNDDWERLEAVRLSTLNQDGQGNPVTQGQGAGNEKDGNAGAQPEEVVQMDDAPA